MVQGVLEMLYTGGLRVDTFDAEGHLRLSSVVQLDGDTVFRIDPATAADPALVEQHAQQLRAALRPLRWLGRSADLLALVAAPAAALAFALASGQELLAVLLGILVWPLARGACRLLLKGLLALGRHWVRLRARHYFGQSQGGEGA